MQCYNLQRMPFAMMRSGVVSWLLRAEDISFALSYCLVANILKLLYCSLYCLIMLTDYSAWNNQV